MWRVEILAPHPGTDPRPALEVQPGHWAATAASRQNCWQATRQPPRGVRIGRHLSIFTCKNGFDKKLPSVYRKQQIAAGFLVPGVSRQTSDTTILTEKRASHLRVGGGAGKWEGREWKEKIKYKKRVKTILIILLKLHYHKKNLIFRFSEEEIRKSYI